MEATSIVIRQSLVRRTLFRGVPPGLGLAEVLGLFLINIIGGLSLGKLVFSVLVGVFGHALLLYLYSLDAYFLETLIRSARYGLVYSGGSKNGGPPT